MCAQVAQCSADIVLYTSRRLMIGRTFYASLCYCIFKMKTIILWKVVVICHRMYFSMNAFVRKSVVL